MQLKARTWLIISIILLGAAAYFWRMGEQRKEELRARAPQSSPALAPSNAVPAPVLSTNGAVRTNAAVKSSGPNA